MCFRLYYITITIAQSRQGIATRKIVAILLVVLGLFPFFGPTTDYHDLKFTMPLPQLTRERSLKLDLRRSARRSSDCGSTATSSTVDLEGSSGSLWNSAYLSQDHQKRPTPEADSEPPHDAPRRNKKKEKTRGVSRSKSTGSPFTRGVNRSKSAGSPFKKGSSKSPSDLSRLFESSVSLKDRKSTETKTSSKARRRPGTRRSASTCSMVELQRAMAKSKKAPSLSQHIQHENGRKNSHKTATKSAQSVSSNPSLCGSLMNERNRFLHVDLLDEYEQIQKDYDSDEEARRSKRHEELDSSSNTLLLDELSQYEEIVGQYE